MPFKEVQHKPKNNNKDKKTNMCFRLHGLQN